MGVVKLLKHRENERTRLLMRQEKTLKVRANHIGESLRLSSIQLGRLGLLCCSREVRVNKWE